MGAKRSWRNRRKNLHQTSGGSAKRARLYVEKEAKRMHRSGLVECSEDKVRFFGFRHHPEHGYCRRVLEGMRLCLEFIKDPLTDRWYSVLIYARA